MAEVMSANTSHLETIDYKPPAAASSPSLNCPSPASPVSSNLEEKKTEDLDHEHEEDDDAKFDLYSDEAEWDEGGKSHCGYSEAVHATLMSVGESVHAVIGEPSPRVEKELKAVGNWFQEASYAARDLFRGPGDGEEANGMKEDAIDAVNTLFRGGSKDKKKIEMEDEEEDDLEGSELKNVEAPKDPEPSTTTETK